MIQPTRKEILKLKKMLTDEDDWMRKNAAWVFGNHPDEARDVIPALIRALEDDDAYVRFWSAKALGKIGSDASDALEMLNNMAENDPFDGQFLMIKFPVRYMAREAIDQIRDKP